METTGLADPAPVVQTLVSDTLLAAQYRLDGVVTLVDAIHGAHQIAHQPETPKQIALADRIFITKSDMVRSDCLESLMSCIAAINPGARLSLIVNGEVHPEALTNIGLGSARTGPATLMFLGESLEQNNTNEGRYLGNLGKRSALHDSAIKTLSLRFKTPFVWDALSSALELLTTLRGPDLLRVKGIVNIDGNPVVIQGVQHIFHPPVKLDKWPSADTDSRLVFITRNIQGEAIRNLLKAVVDVSTFTPSQ